MSRFYFLLWLLLGCMATGCSKENEAPPPLLDKEIPDSLFLAYCLENFDTDGDGQLSDAEAKQVSEIHLQDISISTLAGIELFTELQTIRCKNVQGLGSVDLTKNKKLVTIDFRQSIINGTSTLGSYPQLTYLHIAYTTLLATCDLGEAEKLEYLFIEFDKAQKIELGDKPQLRSLSLRRGSVSDTTSIDFRFAPQLEYLDMRGIKGKFGKVNLRGLSKLKEFYYGAIDPAQEAPNTLWNLSACVELESVEIKNVSGNLALDLGPCNKLKRLKCDHNIDGVKQRGLSIQFPENGCLEEVDLEGMNVAELDLSRQSELTRLRVDKNPYKGTTVFAWPVESKIESLSFSDNISEAIDITPLTRLRTLKLNKNRLVKLNLAKNRALEQLECQFNYLDLLDLSQNTQLKTIKLNDNPDLNSLILPVADILLDSLEIERTPIRELDLSGCIALKSLSAAEAAQLSTVYVDVLFQWLPQFKLPDFTRIIRKENGEEVIRK